MHIDLAPSHHFVVNPVGSTAEGGPNLHENLRKELPWHRPLPQRLRIALNLGVLCCFLAAGLLIAWIRASNVSQQAQEQLRAEARALATGMVSALEQRDRVDIRGLLESMVHRRDFAAVAVHDATGQRLALYGKSRDRAAALPGLRTDPAQAPGFFASRFPSSVVLREPVRNASTLLGTVVLSADLSARWQTFFGEMAWICAALLFSLLLCAALVNLVQQHMVEPVYRLERTCKVIVEDRDYTLRAWKAARDEVGSVADCVNHLLDELHRRGGALVEARTQIAQALAQRAPDAPRRTTTVEDSATLRTQFLSNMCHEIRTPLNRAGALCRDLQGTTLSNAQRDLVSSVRATGDLVVALLDDLLDYTRLESGKLEIQPTEFDPAEVVDTVIRMHAERASARRLKLTWVRSDGVPPRVRGDRTRLRQVIGTLIGNTLKYAQDGEVTVSLHAQEAEGAISLRVDVLDSGFGIAEEARQRVHEALTQNLQGHGAPTGSAGLGITIANHLIQRMGGALSLCDPARGRAGFSFSVRVESVPGVHPSTSPEVAAQMPRSTAVATADTGITNLKPALPAVAQSESDSSSHENATAGRVLRSRRGSTAKSAESKRRPVRDRANPAAPELAHQLAEVYLDSAPDLVESLRATITQGSAAEIRDAAHTLGLCSARVGANQVADLCRRIEDLPGQGEPAQLQRAFDDLVLAFERAKASLARDGIKQLDTTPMSSRSLSTTLQ